MDNKDYRIPLLIEFVDGFEYERTDGGDWYKKTYRKYIKTYLDNDEIERERLCEYQRGDVEILIPQKRVRVKK
jgi:hypothetical protein